MSGGHSKIDDWVAAEQEEEDARKPTFKRDKQGVMRQEGLRYEFDCPECDANNPWNDGFKEGDELQCHYCGQGLKVMAFEPKRIRWRLI